MKFMVMNVLERVVASATTISMATWSTAAMLAVLPVIVSAADQSAKPTIVLVHGAFAGSSSWNGVVSGLLASGYPVVAVANPLRGLKSDASHVGSVLQTIQGPVILVGHSYGGSVISDPATAKSNVMALIYVAAIAPEVGETVSSLSGKFPGGTLGSTLAPEVLLADGSKDLYIVQEKFPAQFAADVPLAEARLMAVTQRPVTEAALNEPASTPSWKAIPSWFIYGSLDRNIPPAAHAFMAKRAGAKQTIEVKGASHVVMVSHPDALVKLISEAAAEIAPRLQTQR